MPRQSAGPSRRRRKRLKIGQGFRKCPEHLYAFRREAGVRRENHVLPRKERLMSWKPVVGLPSHHHGAAAGLLKEQLPKIGRIRLIQGSFCQYSSRYDNFKKGIIAPAFDPKRSGGAPENSAWISKPDEPGRELRLKKQAQLPGAAENAVRRFER